MMETSRPLHFLTWTGIILCISQSAMLSGLNPAYFTVSKLERPIEVAKNNRHASRVLALRENANFLLVTFLSLPAMVEPPSGKSFRRSG